MAGLKQILRPALDFVLPPRCPCCGEILPADGGFCSECWQRLHFIAPPWCASCALPLPYSTDEALQCASCLAQAPQHDGIRAAVAYDDNSRMVALRLKYGGKIGLARMIAMQLVRHVPEDRQGLIITPVPLHWTRLWRRSFNQSALIAHELARLSGVEMWPALLIRQRMTPSLRGLSVKERNKAVGTAFAINPRHADRIKGARIILVDDVLTTGATSDGCFKVLHKGGASWMQLFCWARVLRGNAADGASPVGLDA